MNISCIIALAALAQFVAVLPCKSEIFEPLTVTHPFAGTERIRNFIRRYEKYFEISPEFIENAQLISSFGYSFDVLECAKRGKCPSGSVVGAVSKIVDFNLHSIEQEIRSAVNSSRQNGCSRISLTEPNRISLTDNVGVYLVKVRGTKRWCDDVLGDFEISSFSGRLTIQISLSVRREPSDDDDSILSISVGSSISVDRKEFFGFWDADSLVGQVIGIAFNVSQIVLDLINSNELKVPKIDFSAAGQIIARFVQDFHRKSDAYKDFVEISEKAKIATAAYQISADETRFFVDDAGGLSVRIISNATLNADWARYYYAVTEDEIKALTSLGESERVYIVRPGDSLWKLAEINYGIGYYFNTIESWNPHFSKGILKPGDRITLKPFYELYGPVDGMLKPGDTLWSFWKQSSSTLSWEDFKRKAIPVGSLAADKVFPLQLTVP